jgi:hypothetical protein
MEKMKTLVIVLSAFTAIKSQETDLNRVLRTAINSFVLNETPVSNECLKQMQLLIESSSLQSEKFSWKSDSELIKKSQK